MDIIVNKNQFKKLVVESKRKYLGGGIHHKVYTVAGDENKIVKIGRVEDVNFYVEQFTKFSDIFPKIYKHGTFIPTKKNFKSYGKQEKLGYVYVEKLDIDLFEKKFKFLKYFDFGNHELEVDWRKALNGNFKHPGMDLFDNTLEKFMEMADDDDKKFFNDLIDIIYRIHELCDSGEICIHHDFDMIDLHDGNFGIDSDGNIKCLDF